MKKFIKDKKGQWAHPGKNTFIPNANGRITMKGVKQPVFAFDDEGNSTVMQPGGEYQFPGNGVYEIPLTEDEAMAYAANGYIVEEMQEGGPIVKQRTGVRENFDHSVWTPSGEFSKPSSVSSHLMAAEEVPGRGWVGFPTLFQGNPYVENESMLSTNVGEWLDMSDQNNGWWPIYEEADRRGEVYDFGEDKEAAIAFGEGSWKDQLPDEGIELTDEEADKYRAGGYVLEELKEGGEDDIVRPPGDSYEYKKVGDKYYARKREGEWEGEGQPGWDLASGESEDAIKYNVFKEQRPEPVVEDPIDYTYDINDRKNFDSRYWNDIKLDQSQDGLKPQYFTASNLPLVGLDGTDPDAEYNAYVAAKPQHTRTPSWVDKNVIKPVTKAINQFQNTSLGPIDDAANLVNDMFVQPVVDLATDTYNDPNKVSGEILQMMVDGVTLPFDAVHEGIRTNIVKPDAKFNTSVLGDPKSLERFGQIAAVVPAIPSVFGKTAKTAAVTNKVDDVVNVANKTKKTISRPKPSTTTAMAETSSGNVVPVNNLQKVKNSPYMRGSDGKTYLKESDYNRFTGTRKTKIDAKVADGEVEILRIDPDAYNPNYGHLLSDKAIDNIETGLKTKLERMRSDQGRKLTFEQEKAYIKKEFPELDDVSVNQAANQAVDARIAEVEGILKNKSYRTTYDDLDGINAQLEISNDVKDLSSSSSQSGKFEKTINPVNKDAKLTFHPTIANEPAVIAHEAGHLTPRAMPIEDEILNAVDLDILSRKGSSKYGNLSPQDQKAYRYLFETKNRKKHLIDDMRKYDEANINLSENELIDKYSHLGQSTKPMFKEEYTFANRIEQVQNLSAETLPYAQELKQELLNRGLIKDWFDEITPEILTKAKKSFSEKPSGFYQADMLGEIEDAVTTTRLLDIAEPSRYKQLADALNKVAPVAVPAAAVGTGTMINEQDGGFIEAKLSDEERDQYRLAGYIVEEIQ